MMKLKYRILLVDDHQMVLAGLHFHLAQDPELEVVGEAATGAMGLDLVKKLAPDILVLDVHLSDMDGVEVARKALMLMPHLRILTISFDTELAWVRDALLAGVAGCIHKGNSEKELARGIRQVVQGNLYLCPKITTLLVEDYKRLLAIGASSQPALSARESEVLRFIAEGLRTKDIALKLGISDDSVETYRRRLVNKLGFGSTAELTKYAVRKGIAHL
jgi:DNA-binding NarL/FixJ family response regulator